MMPLVRSVHFWVVFALLGSATVLIRWRGDTDHSPAAVPLEQFPLEIGPWTGADVPLQNSVLEMLGKGDFLTRNYQIDGVSPGVPKAPPVGLFIGYFPTQRSGQSIHSPQNCLPGAGWSFESKGTTTLGEGPHGAVTVGEYMISNGKARDEVLYWYRSHGRTMASDYKAKWFTLVDSIRLQRTDAALVRVITSVPPGEDPQQAHQRVVAFAQKLDALLPAYIPD